MTNAKTCRLKMPLAEAHIMAAGYLYREHMPLWRDMDAALAELAAALPGFDRPTVMLKVTTVNALYRAWVFDTHLLRVASHISQVMATEVEPWVDPGLVTRLAALPRKNGPGIERRYKSFASKFAHFFVNPAAFPIYDTYACKTVHHHLLGIATCDDPPYDRYVDRVAMLRAEVGGAYHYTELDHYLWLSGEYREWLNDHDAGIDPEARSLFAHPPTHEAEKALAILAGRHES